MASLTRLKARGASGKPSWRIQFYDGAGDRRAVHLGALPKKAAETWQSRIEQLNACTVAGVAIDADLADQIRRRTDELTAKAEGRRVKERRAAGAAYAAIRARGTSLRDIARKAGLAESVIREYITAAEDAAKPAAKLAGKSAAAADLPTSPPAADAPGVAGGAADAHPGDQVMIGSQS